MNYSEAKGNVKDEGIERRNLKIIELKFFRPHLLDEDVFFHRVQELWHDSATLA